MNTQSLPAQELSREESRVLELDGLRGTAIVLVVIWHYFTLGITPEPKTLTGFVHLLTRMTWTGVDLFFVLSGYLISTNLTATRARPGYFGVFYIRRCARILPLYFAVLALYCLCALTPIFERASESAIPSWTFATFAQNLAMAQRQQFAGHALSVTWSLAVEEQFYLLLPLIIWLAPPRLLPWLAAGMVASAPVVRVAALARFGDLAPLPCYVLLPTRWDSLFLGVMVGWLVGSPVRRTWIVNHRMLPRFAFLVLAAGMAWMTLTARGVIMSRFVTAWGYTWIGLFYAVLLVLVLTERESFLNRMLRSAWLCRVGVLSFGIYLFHEAINHVVRHQAAELESWAASGIAMAMTLILAELSWRWFESPIVAWSRRVRHGSAVTA